MTYKSTKLKKFSYFTIPTANSENQMYFVTIYSTIFRIEEVIWSRTKSLKISALVKI